MVRVVGRQGLEP